MKMKFKIIKTDIGIYPFINEEGPEKFKNPEDFDRYEESYFCFGSFIDLIRHKFFDMDFPFKEFHIGTAKADLTVDLRPLIMCEHYEHDIETEEIIGPTKIFVAIRRDLRLCITLIFTL